MTNTELIIFWSVQAVSVGVSGWAVASKSKYAKVIEELCQVGQSAVNSLQGALPNGVMMSSGSEKNVIRWHEKYMKAQKMLGGV